jgi:hypothetical protein
MWPARPELVAVPPLAWKNPAAWSSARARKNSATSELGHRDVTWQRSGWSLSFHHRCRGMTMFKSMFASAWVLVMGAQALADGMQYSPYRYYPGFYLPPERHVIEVVQPPFSGNFIINGRRFVGQSPACLRWAAGERIKLVAGDWNGQCVEAVFYNYFWRSTCVTACGWGW